MKLKASLFFLVCGIAAHSALAQTKIELQPSDIVQTILEKQVGQTIELRMTSGEKLGGKLEKVNEKLAHLSSLSGAEFFDAVVVVDDIAAVVVRARAK